VKVIAKDESFTNDDFSPLVKSMKGSIKAPDHFNYKKELSQRLTHKYEEFYPSSSNPHAVARYFTQKLLISLRCSWVGL